MGCSYLEGKNISYCGASLMLMVPSLEEIKTFCATDEYNKCLVFHTHSLRNSREKEEMNEMACAG